MIIDDVGATGEALDCFRAQRQAYKRPRRSKGNGSSTGAVGKRASAQRAGKRSSKDQTTTIRDGGVDGVDPCDTGTEDDGTASGCQVQRICQTDTLIDGGRGTGIGLNVEGVDQANDVVRDRLAR